MSELPPTNMDAAREQIAQQAADARRRNQGLRNLADSVESATGTASSRDGAVAVTATATGAVSSVVLADAALGLGAKALGDSVTRLIAEAQRSALESAARLGSAELGDDHPLVSELHQAASRLPRPDEGLTYS